MAFRHSGAVEVRPIEGKGLGVFARRPIEAGETIERVPVLVLPAEEVATEDRTTRLYDYAFAWGPGRVAVALGYGSLYNHSYEPNARYEDVDRETKLFTAIRDIAAGEEVTVNYNGEPDDRSPVGFAVVDGPAPAARVEGRNRVGSPSRGGRPR